MRRICLSLLFVAFCAVCRAQQPLTISSELTASSDPAVPEIAAVWEQYVFSLWSDSVRTDLWLDGRENMLRHAQPYGMGEQYTFGIRKSTDDIYEINTLSQFQVPDGDPVILGIYKVCAVERDGSWKLLNYFDVVKPSLNRHAVGPIEYYYPPGVDFKREQARQAVRFLQDFKSRYGIADEGTITYIVARNMDECSALLGFPYTQWRSEKLYAGRAIYPRVLLSARPDHIHELVHAVMLPLYHAPALLSEGMATYYGGGSDKSYAFHAANLKKHLSEHPTDLSKEVRMQIEGQAEVLNTLGAMIIDHTLQHYGAQKVLTLFEAADYEEVFAGLGVAEGGINEFIYRELIK